ncbi:hypothetical protein AB0C74_13080 [Spirillospora sp. NPDC048832]
MDVPPTLAELLPNVGAIAVPAGAGISTTAARPAPAAGARLVIIDTGPTPYDGLAGAVPRRPLGEAPPRPAGLALGTGR